MRVVQIAKNVQKCTQHLNLHGNQDPRILDLKHFANMALSWSQKFNITEYSPVGLIGFQSKLAQLS